MFWDEDYIDEEIDSLKDMIENNTFDKNRSNNFIANSDLEDDFSHNEIGEAQEMFMQKVKEFLSNGYPGKYAMWCDWCVHITTAAIYRKIMQENHYDNEYRRFREKRDIII